MTNDELIKELKKADDLLIFILDQHHDVLLQPIYEDVWEYVNNARKRRLEGKSNAN